MLKTKVIRKSFLKRPVYLVVVLMVLVSGLAPLLYVRNVSADQMTNRSLTISSAQPDAQSLTYTYAFTTILNQSIQSMELEMCTTAIGTCLAPTGCTGGGSNCVNAGTEASRSGWTNATVFARNATAGGGCAPANNVLCLDRSQAAAETPGARTLGWNTQRNPTSNNTTFFMRITIYSDTGWTDATPDTGTVATSTTQYLEVSAYVAEVLSFCIGTTAVDDATSAIAANCAAVSGTTVNIGVLDTALVNVSPVAASPYVGNGFNGVAMIRTNAINGAAVTYKAIQAGGGAVEQLGTLRTVGSTCSATETTYTDPCIRAQGITQAVFNPSADERFGMTVAGINCQSVQSYTCTFSAGTYNLVRDAQYDGDGTNNATNFDDDDQVTPPTTSGYAWDQTGTADTIASSTGSSTKVIDDEALILKFAAYSAITTPFGTYTARADFISIATY